MICQDVYIGVGSNLGDRYSSIKFALDQIRCKSRFVRMSSLYKSNAQGFTRQPHFINCVFEVTTPLSPWSMLALIGEIESFYDRHRVFPNAPRRLDLDILFWGKTQLNLPGLSIPHPRVLKRGFALAPLIELCPQFKHPFSKVALKDAYDSIPAEQKPVKLNKIISCL